MTNTKNRAIALAMAFVMLVSLMFCGFAAGTEACAEESDGSLQRVLDAGKLTIGAEGNWEPYVFNQGGTGALDGFEVAMAKEIAARLGVEAEEEKYISDSWDGVLAGLEAERYDVVICGCSPNPTRQEMYSVSDPYGEQLIALVVNAKDDSIQGFEDLAGKVSANSLTSSSGNIARSYGAELVEASLEQGMMLIAQGRADCTINDAASINSYLQANPDAPVRIAAYYVPENAYEIQSAVICRKADVELRDAINAAIADIIADGTAYELAVHYFGKDFADNVTLYPKAEAEPAGDGSLERVLAAGKLTVGAEGNWEPYVFNQGGTGALDGFEVAMAKAIAEKLGVEVEEEKYISDSWDGVLAGLEAERYDVVICGCSPNPTRQEMYSVSDPYGEQLIALVVKADNESVQGFEDLAGKVSANSLTSSSGNIARSYGAELVEASLEQGMMLIAQGRADCTINDAASINSYLQANPDAPIRIAAYYVPENAYEIQSAVICRKADVDLRNAINDAIAELIADGTAYELAVHYFGQDFADNVTLYK